MDVIGEDEEADNEDESYIGKTRGDLLGENKEEAEEVEPPKEEVTEAPKKEESPADPEEKVQQKSPVLSPPPGKAPAKMRA